ncbi:MAG: Cystathionine beta-lyase PatB [candidate division WS2 bacterium]|uniref:cysteine-S-conjugate beta-lyase n=1 Tax=Psychracetigena formicireducens TaxID=2986056 RepID=A0A9E2F6J1_PSYF1|nr:Cystathionine beta-lyase PatB [Candidatus Psychracetigena formicireducens]MBT9145395.1 Cystathionine beta-lyase PatB [Candidatus Psychracetigena formicireducens]MBT9150412.1 Cystathionine beta-lyase PatB [Candidatus Psychracetigena formicireducens]
MKYDFDKVIERRGTDSTKWDYMPGIPRNNDVLPMWVADMDFICPQPVIEALKEKIKHGIYGYSSRSSSYFESITGWLKRRHNCEIKEEWLTHSPGVLPAIFVAIMTFTNPGDKVILQPPVYPPFHSVVEGNGRKLVYNQLKEQNGLYVMDYLDLERKIDNQVKMIIFCSPHNPGGRVWNEDELLRLGEICLKHKILIISDEIHCDLLFKGYNHIPIASLSEELAQNTITCISASKTFNMGGLTTSANIIPNQQKRELFNKTLESMELDTGNLLGMAGLEAAFRYGDEWLDELLEYLEGNLNYLVKFLKERIPQIKPMIPQGTYLVWLDCRELKLTPPELMSFMINKAKVRLSGGKTFGPGGEEFLRLNLACPRSTLEEGLKRIEEAIISA